jgi:hypothetical protein
VLQECHKGATMMLQECYDSVTKSVTRVAPRSRPDPWRPLVPLLSPKGVTDMLQGVTEVLQRCYRGVTGVLQRCYRGVTEVFTKVLWKCYRSVTEVLQRC